MNPKSYYEQCSDENQVGRGEQKPLDTGPNDHTQVPYPHGAGLAESEEAKK